MTDELFKSPAFARIEEEAEKTIRDMLAKSLAVASVAGLPWAQDTRLQQLHPSLLTTNVSNRSGNLLFAQR
jgi:hypothetical protein